MAHSIQETFCKKHCFYSIFFVFSWIFRIPNIIKMISFFAKSMVFTACSLGFLGFFGFFGFLKDFRNFPGRMPRPVAWHVLRYPARGPLDVDHSLRAPPRGMPRGLLRGLGYSSMCHVIGLGILPGKFRKSSRNQKNQKNQRKHKEHAVKTMLFAKNDTILMILGIRKI